MKFLVSTILIFAAIVVPSSALAADTVEKTICKLAVGYQDVDESKLICWQQPSEKSSTNSLVK